MVEFLANRLIPVICVIAKSITQAGAICLLLRKMTVIMAVVDRSPPEEKSAMNIFSHYYHAAKWQCLKLRIETIEGEIWMLYMSVEGYKLITSNLCYRFS